MEMVDMNDANQNEDDNAHMHLINLDQSKQPESNENPPQNSNMANVQAAVDAQIPAI